MKNKTIKRLKKLGIILGLGLASYFPLKEGFQRGTDYIFQTPSEIALEEKTGKPIYLGYFCHGEKRNNRVEWLERVLNKTEENLDKFDQQFDLVPKIRVRPVKPFSKRYLGKVKPFGGLIIHPNDETLAHELAHYWHLTGLNFEEYNELNEKWDELSNNHYVYRWEKAKLRDCEKSGVTEEYGLKNRKESIATTAEFVYILNNPGKNLTGFPNKTPSFKEEEKLEWSYENRPISEKSIPTLIEKIKLLEEYDFISKRECSHAINELNGFKKIE